MKNKLLYIGKFYPWNDRNESDLEEALETFDKVIIAVTKLSNKRLKGQPTKLLAPELMHRIKIIYFDKLKDLLNFYGKRNYKYIMFERR